MLTHIPLPTLGLKPRLVEHVDEMRAPPRSRLAAFLDALDAAELATYGPDPWGPDGRVLEVIGKRRTVQRIAADVGAPLDLRARRRLAKEGWFLFGPVHVRVISPVGAEIIAAFVDAFRRAELRCASPRWRYEATRGRNSFRTVFSFVDCPSETWIVMMVESTARRFDVDFEQARGRSRIDARIGDLDLTFELP